MHDTILSLGGITLRTYSVFMASAVLVGVAIAVDQGRRRGIESLALIDGAIVALLAGMAGARLEYVLLNLDYFVEQPLAALRIWEGGFALHGGVWIGLVALALYAHLRRLRFRPLADAFAAGFSAGAVLGWLACLYAGAVYGRTGFGFLHFVWYDAFGVLASRFAVQPLGAASALAVTALLLLSGRRMLPGAGLLLALSLLGAVHLGLGFARADDTLWWAGWRVDQWAAAIQTVCALVLLARLHLQPLPVTQEPA